jgi:hypothetical protein
VSELIRPEHAERVRDFYRNQGVAKERERIIEALQGLTHTETDEWDSEDDVWLNDKWITIRNIIKGETK